jgi:hypothetical protein
MRSKAHAPRDTSSSGSFPTQNHRTIATQSSRSEPEQALFNTDGSLTRSQQQIDPIAFQELPFFPFVENELQGNLYDDVTPAETHRAGMPATLEHSADATVLLAVADPESVTPQSSSSSSLVIITPTNETPYNSTSRATSSGTGGRILGTSVTPEELQLYHEAAKQHGGPCSNTWQMPPWVSGSILQREIGSDDV